MDGYARNFAQEVVSQRETQSAYIPCRYLYVSITSPRKQRYINDGKSIRLSLSAYRKLCRPGTILVARLCTTSIKSTSQGVNRQRGEKTRHLWPRGSPCLHHCSWGPWLWTASLIASTALLFTNWSLDSVVDTWPQWPPTPHPHPLAPLRYCGMTGNSKTQYARGRILLFSIDLADRH